MQNDKLLPCPFCGGEAEFCKGDWIGKEYWVKCTKCICKTSLSNNYNEPIKAWNTRKPMERIVEQLEKEIDPYYFLEPSWETREVRTNKHKGFCDGICKAIKIVKGGVDNG